MSKNNFLEFVTVNPPAFVPGQILYWFAPETGEIRTSKTNDFSLALTSNWEWKIYDPDEEDLITLDEDPYYCSTPERAKEFRDELGTITYSVLAPAEDGYIISDDIRYKYLKNGILDVTTMNLTDNFFTAIMRIDAAVAEGMIIKLTDRENYLILPDGDYEQCIIKL